MKTKGYSIWIIPKGAPFKILSSFINKLSKDYATFRFVPHVTVVGGVEGLEEEIIEKFKKFAKSLNPFNIELKNASQTNYYFKALFIKVKPTKEVKAANDLAKQIFALNTKEKYEPHLSLIYGDLPQVLKRKIIKDKNPNSLKLFFQADQIYLYKTDGEVEDWKKIAEVKLTKAH